MLCPPSQPRVFTVVDINCPLSLCTQNGGTPLMAACLFGHVNVVLALVEAHANVNAQDKVWYTGWSSHRICNVSVLLWSPINRRVQQHFIGHHKKATLMWFMCYLRQMLVSTCRLGYCSLYMLLALILVGYICKIPSFFHAQNGRTALFLASWRGHVAIIHLLLQRQANVNICTKVWTLIKRQCIVLFCFVDYDCVHYSLCGLNWPSFT